MPPASQRIVVVGGLNMDIVIRLERLPGPGETIGGGELFQAAGGKGANQAVAAARLGAAVAMVGRIGRDAFGRELRRSLRAEGIDTRALRAIDARTGVAAIVLDRHGENSIAVASGANTLLRPTDLPRRLLARADVVLTQLESPLDTVEAALLAARAGGAHTVLNAAPAADLSRSLLGAADVVIVNEHELATLLGRAVAPGQEGSAALTLRAFPDQVAVVTLGERGALAVTPAGVVEQPAFPVSVVDTTGAGDAFVAAFSYAYWPARDLPATLRFACAAGALATTRPGAQPSLPTAREVAELLSQAGAPDA